MVIKKINSVLKNIALESITLSEKQAKRHKHNPICVIYSYNILNMTNSRDGKQTNPASGCPDEGWWEGRTAVTTGRKYKEILGETDRSASWLDGDQRSMDKDKQRS